MHLKVQVSPEKNLHAARSCPPGSTNPEACTGTHDHHILRLRLSTSSVLDVGSTVHSEIRGEPPALVTTNLTSPKTFSLCTDYCYSCVPKMSHSDSDSEVACSLRDAAIARMQGTGSSRSPMWNGCRSPIIAQDLTSRKAVNCPKTAAVATLESEQWRH